MDPAILIVTALIAGATAGLQSVAGQAIKDAYEGIKALILHRYPTVSLEWLEKKPESEAKQKSVAEDLRDTNADQDAELLDQSKVLLDMVNQHAQHTLEKFGVQFEEIEAAYVKIQKVRASGTGVSIRKSKFSEGIEIDNVDAGLGDSTPKD